MTNNEAYIVNKVEERIMGEKVNACKAHPHITIVKERTSPTRRNPFMTNSSEDHLV